MTSIFIEFLIFVFLQACLINGAYESFSGGCVNDLKEGRKCSGNILYMINPEFFERNKNKYWSKPFFSCVKCMASVWGGGTFWIFVPMYAGFHWQEIFLCVADIFILVTLNYWIYKKL